MTGQQLALAKWILNSDLITAYIGFSPIWTHLPDGKKTTFSGQRNHLDSP